MRCLFVTWYFFVVRENCGWDEKLAMDFKSTQRRIASSVSTSCLAGMDMVKNELSKCMAEDILG